MQAAAASAGLVTKAPARLCSASSCYVREKILTSPTQLPTSCSSSSLPSVRAFAEQERVVQQFSRLATHAGSTLKSVATQITSQDLQQHTEHTAAQLRAQAAQLQATALLLTAHAKAASSKFSTILNEAGQGQGPLAGAAQVVRAKSQRVQQKLSSLVQEAERNKAVLVRAAEGAPAPIKEIAETAIEAHSVEKVRKGAVIHDFCLGITYGALLLIAGLVSFLLSGSVAALRFGVLLGGVVLGAGMGSLRAWKDGHSSTPYIAVQAAVSYAIFSHDLASFLQTKALFPHGLMAALSIAMVAFYAYVVLAGGNPPKKTPAAVDN